MVIQGQLCRRLIAAHKGRSRIEHRYIETPAGDVPHEARLVRETAAGFIRAYRDWIEPLLRP